MRRASRRARGALGLLLGHRLRCQEEDGGVPARPCTAGVFVVEKPVPLEQLQEEDVVFVGSAFAYNNCCLATCAHLFERRREKESRLRLLLRFGDGRLASAELTGLSAAADVAVLKLQGTQAKPLRFNDTLPRQGDQVSVCGMTQHGLEAVSLSGHVSQPRQRFRGLGEDPATRFVQLALPTLPGMSGSPVLDKDGKVVAMVAKKFEEHGLAIPATRVRQVAECLEAGHPWRLPMLGLEVQAAGTLAAPAVLVKALKPGSAAGAAGVEVGDVIVAIDDTPVAGYLERKCCF